MRASPVGARVVPAQEAILGERHDDDRSAQWCLIAEDDDSSTALRAVIDLGPRRLDVSTTDSGMGSA